MSNLAEDVYVVLVDWQEATPTSTTFHVYHNPLVNWFWIGAVVMVLGGIVALGFPRGQTDRKQGDEHP
jgi:cytochrome c-type biogenesis protein CcmF